MIFSQAWPVLGAIFDYSAQQGCREGQGRSGIDAGWASMCTSKEKEECEQF
jgi:hypothetical protein